MATLLKQARRALRRRTDKIRHAVILHSPDWLKSRLGRPAAYAELMISDHGLFRIFYLNRHRISRDAWRAAQPAPRDIRRFAREGARTIVNLRGPRDCSSYALEKEACDRYGLKLVDYRVRSRAAPSLDEIRGAKELFESLEYPIVLHCKSGADRAGLMSALFMHFHEGRPIAEAKQQLSLRYGHVSQAETGVLDYFFERYLAYNESRPIDFLEWVETVYDPAEVKGTFRAKGWANRLVDSILRRE